MLEKVLQIVLKYRNVFCGIKYLIMFSNDIMVRFFYITCSFLYFFCSDKNAFKTLFVFFSIPDMLLMQYFWFVKCNNKNYRV